MKVTGFTHEVLVKLIFTGKDLRVMNECSNRNPLVSSRNLSQVNGLLWKMLTMMFYVEFGANGRDGKQPTADQRHEMLQEGELDNLVWEETLTIEQVKDLIKVMEYTTPFRNSARNNELLHCMKLHTDLTAAMNSVVFEKDRCHITSLKTAN